MVLFRLSDVANQQWSIPDFDRHGGMQFTISGGVAVSTGPVHAPERRATLHPLTAKPTYLGQNRMRILDRPIRRIFTAPFEWRHYRALANMFMTCDGFPAFIDTVRRYCFASGKYPYTIRLRTPTGFASPTLYSYHDMLTVNEVFFRQDYRSAATRVVVDVGANIGLSALYFLTRDRNSRCYLFEPVPENTLKLRLNLSGFESRYVLREAAVSTEAGTCDFSTEPTGRYGGIGLETGSRIRVEAVDINSVLGELLAEFNEIDVLKIDVEGHEEQLVAAISSEYSKRIDKMFVELVGGHVLTIESRQAAGSSRN